jgi:hypothetical protein
VPKAQVTLTNAESKSLHTLAQRTGKSQDELLREAVRQLLASRQDDRLIFQFVSGPVLQVASLQDGTS